MNRLRERRIFIQGRDQFAGVNIRGDMVGHDLRDTAASLGNAEPSLQ